LDYRVVLFGLSLVFNHLGLYKVLFQNLEKNFRAPTKFRSNFHHKHSQTSQVPFQYDHLQTKPSPILIFFCTFAGIKKQKISALHVFQKYTQKTIYSGINFSSFLDFRLILSITAQSIFAVEPSAWTRSKGILIENIIPNQWHRQSLREVSQFVD
jgi:hypothetical protein